MSNLHEIIQQILNNTNSAVVLVLFTSFFTSLFSIPIILHISRSKNIFDKPNGRTSHFENTPTLGGIAIFVGFVISILLFGNISSEYGLQYLIASLMIVFFIGIKDDIYLISLSKKFIWQFIIIFILIFLGDFRFLSLGGFLGIYEIPYFISVVISAFVFIVLINCINLIDGVDGLASGLSIVIAGIFAVFFYSQESRDNLLISIGLLGSLIPFFIYNVFGKKNKLFMGDTGALIIGVISVVLVIKFNVLSTKSMGWFEITAAPAMSIAIFFIPLYDTLQVFTFRILNRKSPFSADKNHLHHRLLRMGLTHIQTSLILISLNLLIIICSYFLQFLGVFALSILLLFTGLLISMTIWLLLRRKKNIQLA